MKRSKRTIRKQLKMDQIWLHQLNTCKEQAFSIESYLKISFNQLMRQPYLNNNQEALKFQLFNITSKMFPIYN